MKNDREFGIKLKKSPVVFALSFAALILLSGSAFAPPYVWKPEAPRVMIQADLPVRAGIEANLTEKTVPKPRVSKSRLDDRLNGSYKISRSVRSAV